MPRVVLRLSTLFLRTLREDPADAEVASHKLLVRAGYIRRAAPGIYTWLPLGLAGIRWRVRAALCCTGNRVLGGRMAATGNACAAQWQDFGGAGSRLPPEPGSGSQRQRGEQRGNAQSHPPPESQARIFPAIRGGPHAGLVRLSRAMVLKATRARTVQQEARASPAQRGLEPVPRMPRLLTCCSSIPA